MKKYLLTLMLALALVFGGCITAVEQGTIIDAEDMVADITSGSVSIGNSTHIYVYCVWEGADSPVGNIIVQSSNDDTNWIAASTQAAGGAAGSKGFNISDAAYTMFRVFYDVTSDGSSDDLTCIYNIKKGH